VQQLAVYSTLAVTLGLVAVRPSVRGAGPLSPALVASLAVALLAVFGAVGWEELFGAATEVWRALVTIGSLMVMTEVAHRTGLLRWAAVRIEACAASTRALFVSVFLLGAASATSLNNDAAILLVTPLVLALVRRLYPDRPALALPFATAVFASAGVAPLLVSNPMNAIAAEMAGIEFLPYAARMAPVAILVWLSSLAALLVLFRRELATPRPARASGRPPAASAIQRRMLLLLGGVLAAYAVVGWAGGPVWSVALAGAAVSILLAAPVLERRPGYPSDATQIRAIDNGPTEGIGARCAGRLALCRESVSWETLGFLVSILILAGGLRQVGFVDLLAAHYQDAGVVQVGVSAAVGSAVLNNHPMAILNVMALDGAGAPVDHVFAALVGGDLGPRLFPAGSLAGLLWVDLLRRHGIAISIRRFATTGLVLTAPALAVSLAFLSLL
jgi:arsenical pump membrane protein